jgi:hypothetical protein
MSPTIDAIAEAYAGLSSVIEGVSVNSASNLLI